MLVRRMLLKLNIADDEYFFGNCPGGLSKEIPYLMVREQMMDDSSILVIFDGTLLDYDETRKWLKLNLHKDVWVRVTGTLEIHSHTSGFYERDVSENHPHRPNLKHVLNLIAVEILSNYALDVATSHE